MSKMSQQIQLKFQVSTDFLPNNMKGAQCICVVLRCCWHFWLSGGWQRSDYLMLFSYCDETRETYWQWDTEITSTICVLRHQISYCYKYYTNVSWVKVLHTEHQLNLGLYLLRLSCLSKPVTLHPDFPLSLFEPLLPAYAVTKAEAEAAVICTAWLAGKYNIAKDPFSRRTKLLCTSPDNN